MIRVTPQSEPREFDALVRRPGRRFLRGCPHPIGKQWAEHSYWRRVLRDLHRRYRGICAYSCHWIPYDTGSDTVEHFRPKGNHPRYAYEWSNYRLVCGTLNGRKGGHEDVIDPFLVETDWFVIDFPSLLVTPSAGLRGTGRAKVKSTIDRLKLNDEGTCLAARFDWVTQYCGGEFTFAYLRRKAPFIALELRRQGLVTAIRTIMPPPTG